MSRAEHVFRSRPIRTAVKAAALATLLSAGISAAVTAQNQTVGPDLAALAARSIGDAFDLARTGQGEIGKWEVIAD
jgi:hypothetical protein